MFDKLRMRNLIMIILLVVYSLIVVIVFPVKGLVFWTGYIFTALASILWIVLNNKLFNDKGNSNFNSLPLAMISFSYLMMQVIVSFILMTLSSFITLEISIIIQVVILAIFLIIAILLFKSRNYISSNEVELEEQLFFIESMRKELEILINKTTDEELKKKLEELLDTIRYSNPVSKDSVKKLESQTKTKYNDLLSLINDNNDDKAFEVISELKNDFDERNTILK